MTFRFILPEEILFIVAESQLKASTKFISEIGLDSFNSLEKIENITNNCSNHTVICHIENLGIFRIPLDVIVLEEYKDAYIIRHYKQS